MEFCGKSSTRAWAAHIVWAQFDGFTIAMAFHSKADWNFIALPINLSHPTNSTIPFAVVVAVVFVPVVLAAPFPQQCNNNQIKSTQHMVYVFHSFLLYLSLSSFGCVFSYFVYFFFLLLFSCFHVVIYTFFFIPIGVCIRPSLFLSLPLTLSHITFVEIPCVNHHKMSIHSCQINNKIKSNRIESNVTIFGKAMSADCTKQGTNIKWQHQRILNVSILNWPLLYCDVDIFGSKWLCALDFDLVSTKRSWHWKFT